MLDDDADQARRESLTVIVDGLNDVHDLPEPLSTIRQTLARLQADVAMTTRLDLPLWVYGADPEQGGYQVGPGLLVSYRLGDDLESFLAELADAQSENVSEAPADAHRLEEARRWPSCPRHDHSLDPALRDGMAVWRCRSDPTVQVRIGELRGRIDQDNGPAN